MIRRRRQLWPLVLAVSALSSLAQAAEVGTYRVIDIKATSALNVRADSNSASADIGSASLGTPLQVVGFNETQSWANVKWEDGYGWVSMRFLSAEGSEAASIAALAALQRNQLKANSATGGSIAAPAPVAVAKAEPQTVPQAEPEAAPAPLNVARAEPAPSVAQAALPPPATAALRHVASSDSPSISCIGHGPNWQLTVNKVGNLFFKAPDENSLYANTQWQQAVDNKNRYAFSISGIEGAIERETCVDKRTQQSLEWRLELNTTGLGHPSQLSGCCSGH